MDRRALRVVAEDRPGLLRDLSARIADAGGNLTWVSVTVHSGEARL
ncbi:ACT domain-containing protein, partial [bacterium]